MGIEAPPLVGGHGRTVTSQIEPDVVRRRRDDKRIESAGQGLGIEAVFAVNPAGARYEALVSDPLTVSRQIAEFVGIPWSEEMVEIEDSSRACSTASAAQVREPIYTSSIGRWRNVADGMEPVRQRLEAARLVDENGNPTA